MKRSLAGACVHEQRKPGSRRAAKLKNAERRRVRRLIEAGGLIEKTRRCRIDSNALYGAYLCAAAARATN